jgi:hypothetical protein
MTQPMSLEEIRAMLDEQGIPHDGSWAKTASGPRKSPIVEKQRELITKVRDLLVEQIERDKNKVAEMHTMEQRLKHGGGL